MTNGDQPTTITDPILTDLQRQHEYAQLRSQIAQQEVALAEARRQLAQGPLTAQLELLQKLFPTGQAVSPAGTITASGDSWGYAEGISVAYEVIADELVNQMIDQLLEDFDSTLREDNGVKAKVLIVDTLQHAQDDLPLAEVTTSIEFFKENLAQQAEKVDKASDDIDEAKDDILGTPEALPAEAGPYSEVLPAVATPLLLGLASAPAIMNTVTSVANYFQSTYSVTGQKFDVPTEGLLGAVASKLGKDVSVCVSNFYAMGESTLLNRFMDLQKQALDLKFKTDRLANQIAKPLNDQSATLNQQIRDLESKRISLDSATKRAEIEEINRDIAELAQRLKSIQDCADTANSTLQASNSLLAECNSFMKAITTSADRLPTKLAQAMLRDKIYQAGTTHILYLKVIFSGGTAHTEQKWGDDKIGFSGEAGLSFLLATKDGDIVSSGLLMGSRLRSRTLR